MFKKALYQQIIKALAIAILIGAGVPALQTVASQNGLDTLPAAAADDSTDPCAILSTVGETSSLNQNCITYTTGGVSVPSTCRIGEYPWAYPAIVGDDGTVTPKPQGYNGQGSILSESLYSTNFFNAGEQMTEPTAGWPSGDGPLQSKISTASWFWQLAKPDMVAATLGIWTGGLKLQSASAWASQITSYGTNGPLVSAPLRVVVTGDDYAGGGVFHARRVVMPTSGTNAAILFQSPVSVNSFPSGGSGPDIIDAINAQIRSDFSSGTQTIVPFNIANVLFRSPSGTYDSSLESTAVQNAMSTSSKLATPGYPIYVVILPTYSTSYGNYSATSIYSGMADPNDSSNPTITVDGHTVNVWSARDLTNDQGFIPTDAHWQAVGVFSGYNQHFTTVADVQSAFDSVVSGQLNQKWTSTQTVAGTSYTGVLFYPAFGQDSGDGSCGPTPDHTFFGKLVILQHDQASGLCPIQSVSNDSQYDNGPGAYVSDSLFSYNGCYLMWHSEKISPPTLINWNAAAQATAIAVDLIPSSQALLVNQPITLSSAPAQLDKTSRYYLPAGVKINVNNSALTGLPSSSATLVTTQVGVSLTLGRLQLPFNQNGSPTYFARPVNGAYNLSFSLAYTAESLLQTPVCAKYHTAADLLAQCGIAFKTDASGHVQPYLHITVHTWWAGIYSYNVPGVASGYCGLYNYYANDRCSSIPRSYTTWPDGSARIIEWPGGKLNTSPLWDATGDASGNLTILPSTQPSPFPASIVYGRYTPSDVGGRWGSPLFNAANYSFDININQVQVEGQDGSNIVNPPLPTPIPTPIPVATPTPVVTPTPIPTPTPTPTIVSKKTNTCSSTGYNLRSGPSAGTRRVGVENSGVTIRIITPAVSGGSWGPYCTKPASGNSWYEVVDAQGNFVGYIFAGAVGG